MLGAPREADVDDDDAAGIEEGDCLTNCCVQRRPTSGESQRKERRLNWRVLMSQRWHVVACFSIIFLGLSSAWLLNLLGDDDHHHGEAEAWQDDDSATYKSVDVLDTGTGEDIKFFTRSGKAFEDGKKVEVHGEEDDEEHRHQAPQLNGPSDDGDDNTFISNLKSLTSNEDRAAAVKRAILHAWDGYKEFAWGLDELRPLTKTGQNWFGLGLTLIDSLDLLWIIGEKEEFDGATQWVQQHFNPSVDVDVNVFEVTIRILGGLLAAYHYSLEPVFLEKAKELGENLKEAFKTRSGIPYSDANLMKKTAFAPAGAPDSSLSEASSIQLEFKYLAYLTNDEDMYSLADHSMWALERARKKLGNEAWGLPPMFVNAQTGLFRGGSTVTIGARGDSYYEYLLKQWLQTGKSEKDYLDAYREGISNIKKILWRYSIPNELAYIGELINSNTFDPKMDHLVCYLPGTLALGYMNGLEQEHLVMAKELIYTCYQMYNTTTTGLSPEIVYFNEGLYENVASDIVIQPRDAHNILRPETVESLFYLYRVTGDTTYQEWGWNIFVAFEEHCRLAEGGYSGLVDVMSLQSERINKMESFWLGETLKYLYLLYAPQDTLSLEDYVFNTEAHPLPVIHPPWLAPPKAVIPKKPSLI